MPIFGKADKVLIGEAKEGKAMLFTNNSKRLIRDGARLDSALIGSGLWNVTTGTYL